jgi:hypothetical protein
MAPDHLLTGRLVDEHDLPRGIGRQEGQERVEGAEMREAVLDPPQRVRHPVLPVLDTEPPGHRLDPVRHVAEPLLLGAVSRPHGPARSDRWRTRTSYPIPYEARTTMDE